MGAKCLCKSPRSFHGVCLSDDLIEIARLLGSVISMPFENAREIGLHPSKRSGGMRSLGADNSPARGQRSTPRQAFAP